jgi:hypothetical protein
MNTAHGAENVLREKALPMAIEHFQILEESIKELLLLYNEIILGSLPEYVSYRPSEPAIRKASLGEVIKRFRVFCDDNDLIKELTELVPLRNSIAHAAYVEYSKVEPTLDNFRELLNNTGNTVQRTKSAIDSVQNIYAQIHNQWKHS